jgi:hypothetical protein
MRTMTVVLREVLGPDLLEMTASEDEEPIRTLWADGADETHGARRSGGSRWGLNDPDALGAESVVEAGRELRVPVLDHELDGPTPVEQIAGEVPTGSK